MAQTEKTTKKTTEKVAKKTTKKVAKPQSWGEWQADKAQRAYFALERQELNEYRGL